MKQTDAYRFPQARIVVFARVPQPGRVKTRLARGLGIIAATRAYRHMAELTISRLAAARLAPITVYCTPHTRSAFFHRWRSRYGVTLRQQHTGHLGRRMSMALATTLRQVEAAVVVGTDAPALGPSRVADALTQLHADADAAFVPCADGGYALVGTRAPRAALFRGVAWSTPRVMATTRTRLTVQGLSPAILDAVHDIDTAADWHRARRTRLLDPATNRSRSAPHSRGRIPSRRDARR